MAAIALSSSRRVQANARERAPLLFPLGHHREAHPHPNPLPRGEGASRFPQSVAHRGRDGPAVWVKRSETRHPRHYRRLSTRLIPSMA